MTSGDRPDVVTVGETMALVRATEIGPLSPGTPMRLGIGGAESNFAVALRRLGTRVAWVSRVGADSLGNLIVRELTAEGVEVHAVRDPEVATALMIKERRTNESQKVWYYRHGMAGSRLAPADVPVDLIADARLLHVTGISLGLSAAACDTVYHAVEIARAHGVLVSFDLNYRGALWSREAAGEAYRRFIPLADLVFGGDDEVAMAVGASDDPAVLAERIVALGPSHAVVKLGARGCAARIDGQAYVRAAVPVRAVDTVGAGDGFVAGYVAEFLAGRGPRECLTTAVTVGAFACLVPGDWEGMPHRAELGLLESAEPVVR